MTRDVHYRERIPATDPRLRRHVNHDPRSRRYPYPTAGLTIQSVRHARRIPVLDQGQLGSCTGNAGIGCLGTDPYYTTVANRVLNRYGIAAGRTYSLDEDGAVQLYSDATKVDPYPGQYPPTDTGSDGLTVAKVLTAAAEISGYTHTFAMDDALKALSQTALSSGTVWLNSMFDPSPEGLVTVDQRSGVAGGHQYVVDEYDQARGWVGFTNSWGAGWGLTGRFYMQAEDWGALLAQQGDVTIFTPLTAPAPTPTPVPPSPDGAADAALAAAFHHDNWVGLPHVGDNHKVAVAAKRWLAERGL